MIKDSTSCEGCAAEAKVRAIGVFKSFINGEKLNERYFMLTIRVTMCYHMAINVWKQSLCMEGYE